MAPSRRPSRLLRSALFAGAASLTIGLSVGCQSACRRPYDIPHGAEPMPLGAATYARMAAQNQAADQAELVVYAHDWYQGGEKLGPEGRERVRAMADRLLLCPDPLVIYQEPQPIVIRSDDRPDLSSDAVYQQTLDAAEQLDARRRSLLVQMLRDAKIPDAEERVVLARGPRGLYGPESPQIYRQLIHPQIGGGMGGRRMGGLGGQGGGMGGFGGGMGGFGGGGFGGGGMGGGFGGGGVF